ncbi:receptor-type tyrosine-protein phosphatase T [Nephila pilipes]|uniref:Receptor-type tyrosine-protein phosphatase T n=1 Tax=Nephila pilipes TaxID=299642 RepID=A0A8X6T957_NEPPI|nr:receptor-type tyrosine-protein phosphatase T [Nephila pilipes]
MARKGTLLLYVCLLAGGCWADIDAVVEPPPPSRELNVEKLDFYVNTDEGKAILFSEFLNIKGGKRKPWTEAEKPENFPKNRYDDLLAFDETRVQLEPRSYDESDYINANYIDGYHRQKEYVATQGPLPNTTRDFWAMIWQLNIRKVVMLANLFEHGKPKVAKYWPDDADTYGDIIVTKLYENEMPEIKHVIRIFSIKKQGHLGFRLLRHFHFTGWPDLGVPEDRLGVLGLLEQVRKYLPEDTAPICVHCSAGVGRTGTVMLMDSMLERARQEGVVNFPERLDHMRVQRVDVVEKKEQYVFAHQGVNDWYRNLTTTQEYLKKVDKLHKATDDKMYMEDFKLPLTLEDALQRIKLHTHRITSILEVIERGFPPAS